jgi:predicted transcriptional regulator
VVKTLASQGPAGIEELRERSGVEEDDLYQVLEVLEKEMMVAEEEGIYRINEE